MGRAGAYTVDLVSFIASFVALLAIQPLPPLGAVTRPGLDAIREGLRFARRRRAILGSFVIDLNGGLGVGLGTKIKVDWSGFPAAWDKAMDNLDAWWNKSASDLYWALHPGGGGSHRF
jgi:hypothetical protein